MIISNKTGRRVAILVFASLLSSACSIRLGDFTALSTKSVSLNRVDLDTLPHTDNVTGEDSKWMILLFPIGFPHLETAVDEALEKGGGDVMTDAVLYSSGWWFLVGKNTLKVKGSVVKTRGAGK
jgi:hypothetical protein